VYEPVVFAHRPICNPVIEHSLRHTLIPVILNITKGKKTIKNVTWEDGETLQITNEIDTINITYNCVWKGETAITVVIPLLPRGQISWTWTKRCIDPTLPSQYESAWDEASHDQWRAWDEQRCDDEEGPLEVNHPRNVEDGTSDVWSFDSPTDDSVGYIDVGTGRDEDSRSNVVQMKLPVPEYSMPQSKEDSIDAVTVVTEDKPYTEFFLTVPERHQRFLSPTVRVLKEIEMCSPVISGTGAFGGDLKTGDVMTIKVDYNCFAPGASPILVSIPLEPRTLGAVSWRFNKICGGFKGEKTFTYEWTTTRVFIWALVASIVIGAVIFWRQSQLKSETLDRMQHPRPIPTDEDVPDGVDEYSGSPRR